MEKLIELLNEYEDGMVSWVKEYSEEFGVFVLNTEQMIEEEIIISKSFGFIKWLVDNDKIDLDKLKDNITFTTITHSIGIGHDWRTVKEGESIIKAIGTNALIAYLSIQDNPIEFLISVLK